MIASVLPLSAAGNKVPLLLPESGPMAAAALLANLNSFAFDFALRQHIGNITLNWFMVRQCPVIPLLWYESLQVDDERLDQWVSRRVLKLTYTSTDLEGWARDLGYQSEPFVWNSEERRQLRAELDALYFSLYQLREDQIFHIMESFPIIKRIEVKQHGYYRYCNEVIETCHNLRTRLSNCPPLQANLCGLFDVSDNAIDDRQESRLL